MKLEVSGVEEAPVLIFSSIFSLSHLGHSVPGSDLKDNCWQFQEDSWSYFSTRNWSIGKSVAIQERKNRVSKNW
jgi:hypothetical protein